MLKLQIYLPGIEEAAAAMNTAGFVKMELREAKTKEEPDALVSFAGSELNDDRLCDAAGGKYFQDNNHACFLRLKGYSSQQDSGGRMKVIDIDDLHLIHYQRSGRGEKMDINMKPENQDPEKQDPVKAEKHEMNDDELDTVSGGVFSPQQPTTPVPYIPGLNK